MQVLSDGRVRRSADEWKKIMDRYRRSTLPVAAFCEKEDISRSSFAAWKGRLSGPPGKKPAFIELARPARKMPAVSSPSTEISFELDLPGGVTLRWQA